MQGVRFVLGALALSACGPAPAAPATSREPPNMTVMATEGAFQEDKGEGNTSGIACLPQQGANRSTCFIVDDEASRILRASISSDRLVAGQELDVRAGVERAFGRPPDDLAQLCERRDPKGFDREAISVAADGYFYLVGSHGCSRSKNRYDAFDFLVTRFRLGADGSVRDLQHSYRLSEALRATPPFGSHFGRRLQAIGDQPSERGLNIEGAVVMGDDLVVGLRAPSLDGKAYLLGVPIAQLFSDAPLSAGRPRELALGLDVGIRDVVALANGDLLVLAGPTEEQDVPFSLYRVTADNGLSWLADVGSPDGKAEAVLVLQESGDSLEIVVLYDLPIGGAPRRYRIAT